MFSRFLSFETPMGHVLIRFVYYIGLFAIGLILLRDLWDAIMYFDDDWDTALWWLIKAPFVAVFKVLILRIIAELALAILRIDTSAHDIVTGRAAPPAGRD